MAGEGLEPPRIRKSEKNTWIQTKKVTLDKDIQISLHLK